MQHFNHIEELRKEQFCYAEGVMCEKGSVADKERLRNLIMQVHAADMCPSPHVSKFFDLVPPQVSIEPRSPAVPTNPPERGTR